MKNNDLQMKRLENFPVSYILMFNIIIVVVSVILYFFSDTYLFSFNENTKNLSPQQLHYFIVEGYRKILISFALWSFILISANMGGAVLVLKMKKALRGKHQ